MALLHNYDIILTSQGYGEVGWSFFPTSFTLGFNLKVASHNETSEVQYLQELFLCKPSTRKWMMFIFGYYPTFLEIENVVQQL